ncbi:hypothetical protein HDU96_007820 [Phlyctochytrium bullatum]|nr:hypothetical protein HDU96_007820 [Phlyctochytrium bullatum]
MDNPKAQEKDGVQLNIASAQPTDTAAPASKPWTSLFGKKKEAADAPGKDSSEEAAAPVEPEVANYKLSYFQLFRYANPFDAELMFVGTVTAIGNGASQPIMTM